MSEQPAIGGRTPVAVEVGAGKDYWWCACGKSANQPFCDGSHQGSTFSPLQYMATETKRAFFCTCKRTANGPLCDGSHNNLPASA